MNAAHFPALRVEGLSKSFGGLRATDGVSLDIVAGEVHALIGPNGAGKTTLLSQLAGELRPDSGSIHLRGENISRTAVAQRVRRGLARSYQITSVLPAMTAEDNVSLALQAGTGHSFGFWADARRDPSVREPARALLERFGLARAAGSLAGALSYGEQRQLELAMALATGARVLLLDEPMAGMGRDETRRMVELLRALKGRVTMVLVEHDMEAVFSLADRISVLVYGRVLMTGTPAQVQESSEVRDAYLGDGSA